VTRQVDALVFDLGGVLIDVSFARAIESWAALAGVPAHELTPRFRTGEVFHAHERGEISDAHYFAALRNMLGIPLDDAAMLSGWNAVIGEPIEGMQALLRGLSDIVPLYVFSNTNAAHIAHWKPRHQGLLAPVREVICSCEIGCRKPDAEAFTKMLRRVGAPPHRIGFFDDNPDNVAGARGAGMHAFHVASIRDVRAGLAKLDLEP
jgi:putative hydrolase of the HAD superfamily